MLLSLRDPDHFKEGIVYSLFVHSLILAGFFILISSDRPARVMSYYMVDLSLVPGTLASPSQDSALSDVVSIPENEDFIPVPSKNQKAQSLKPVKTIKSDFKPSLRKSNAQSRVGVGAGTGAVIGGGAGISNFPYPLYTEVVRKKIAQNWEAAYWKDNLLTRNTQVVFTVNRDGSISSPKIERKSGDDPFDLTCLRAVGQAVPFPPLPQGFPSDQLKIVFDFDIVE